MPVRMEIIADGIGRPASFVSDWMSAFGQVFQECGGPLWVESQHQFQLRTHANRATSYLFTSYLFTSNPTITTPTPATNHISATLLVAVMAPPATTGPTTALSE